MNREILLVEDTLGDVRLTQEAFRDVKVPVRLHVVSDGLEAIDFLKRRGSHSAAHRPDMILLDLNLPKLDGREVLANIKEDCELKTIPVVVLTTSGSEDDIVKSYRLHANCYLTKPVDLNDFVNLVQSIGDFWLSKVELPKGGVN